MLLRRCSLQQRIALTRPIRPRFVALERSFRHQAFEAAFNPDELAEARLWRQSFEPSKLPKGNTSYSRSSGPGGQHVNKTESKATSVWPVKDLLAVLPKMLHGEVRASKYYTAGNDSWTIQAQQHRSRNANVDENQQKLVEEVERIYASAVPGETSDDTKEKHKKLDKAFHEARIRSKKQQSSKKQSRKGGFD